ncbi:tRNA wybutosine-synthesizing protein 3 homolog isoform X2 [Scophthalmus maximus]|uniref:tRNA wybutosine-synthesizing protein 3 homolog n=1 Tax=Scophthalmus maximus TaxID=52904 RepID=A0A8D3BCH5_SCOMX|nr:tRNA wybutosine-synthesizing protein 3 homolog isoform X2 [Scophthalmus maximus]
MQIKRQHPGFLGPTSAHLTKISRCIVAEDMEKRSKWSKKKSETDLWSDPHDVFMPPESSDVQKQNCVWLLVSHQKCTADELVSGLAKAGRDAVLKFEPFVLHVQCRRLEDAQLVHSAAINSGFRNSGLTVGKSGKIITAVRSTHGLEVPLSHDGKLLVAPEYLHFLTQIANQKMEENLRRIHRFYQNLQSALTTEKLQTLQLPDPPSSQGCSQSPPDRLETEKDEENKASVYKRRRRRERHQADCCHGDESSGVQELDDCLDLLT